MSCPLNRNRWAGSGYTKPATESADAKALNDRIAAMQAERAKQDATLFPHALATATVSCGEKVCLPNMAAQGKKK